MSLFNSSILSATTIQPIHVFSSAFSVFLSANILLPRFWRSCNPGLTLQASVTDRSVTCMIRSRDRVMYDIHLRATTTMILSIRGVTIPINLVSSAMDSIRRRVVLFKLVPVPTSDPKSEFLCQSSQSAQNLQTPLNHLVRLGYLPRLCSPCIIPTPRALVLSPNTLKGSCISNVPNDSVTATLLKSSRTFHLNVTPCG